MPVNNPDSLLFHIQELEHNIVNQPVEEGTRILQSVLQKTIQQFGGFELAMNIEDKTRDLVQKVLLHAIQSYEELQIDMEISLDLFSTIRPDICVVERRNNLD